MEVKTGLLHLQAKEHQGCWQRQKLEGTLKGPPQSLQREHRPTDTLISDFCLQNSERINSCCDEPPSLWSLVWQPGKQCTGEETPFSKALLEPLQRGHGEPATGFLPGQGKLHIEPHRVSLGKGLDLYLDLSIWTSLQDSRGRGRVKSGRMFMNFSSKIDIPFKNYHFTIK